MALQLSVAVRNAELDVIESTIGTSAIMKIFDDSDTMPANCAAGDGSAVVLATLTLPSDWMAAASAGAKAKNGTWEDTAADADGDAQHFRIYDSGGSTCHIQGTVGVGSGDLQVQNLSFATGQKFTVTGFTLTAGGA